MHARTHARMHARTHVCTHARTHSTTDMFRVAKSRNNSLCLVKTPDRQFYWIVHDTHVAMGNTQATTVGRDQTGNFSNLIQKIQKSKPRPSVKN